MSVTISRSITDMFSSEAMTDPKTGKGDKWLRATLNESANAAARTKDFSYLAAQYQRLRGRRGRSKAVIAVGHSILTAAWHMLQTGDLYRDLGGDYVTLMPTNQPQEIAA